MKKIFNLFNLIVFLILLGCLLQACVSSEITSLTGIPQDLIHYIILGLLALYEIIVRIIPTVADYSVVAFVIKILKWLSDATNRTKVSP
jgi:hypothetical protein